jgi:hypothetical protein
MLFSRQIQYIKLKCANLIVLDAEDIFELLLSHDGYSCLMILLKYGA